MKKYFGTILFLITAVSLASCEKDTSVYSYTAPPVVISPSVPLANGSLQDSLGNCSKITIYGSFVKGIALTSNNYITATVNFTQAGKYKIYTNSVNGCWFSMDSAVTTTTGTQPITLKGFGTPIVSDTASFTITFLNTNCSFNLITASGPHIPSETDYFPLTTGSYITYNTDTVANRYAADTLRYSFNGLTQTVNGVTYKVATSNKKDIRLYRKDGLGHYYEYTTQFTSYGVAPFEYMFLDDTKKENDSWQTDSFPAHVNAFGIAFVGKIVLKCTILHKNVLFNGITPFLDSTIEVQESLSAKSNDGNNYSLLFSFFVPTMAYYTKKVGLVEYDATMGNTYLRIKDWYIQ